MQPNLLMRARMMAHLYGAEYQAVVCHAGSSGEVAFRESLCPQYTSHRHDAKGLRTYHITGTCYGTSISRIVCGQMGNELVGASTGPLHITVTSNTHSWQNGDLSYQHLVRLDLDMQSIVSIASGFLSGCDDLKVVDLSPLVNLREVGSQFLGGCTQMKSIDLSPLHAVRVLPEGFLCGCSGLEEVDLSPLVNLREVGSQFLGMCSSMKSIDLAALRVVEVLPEGFLTGCSALERVDLSLLDRLIGVGQNCLEHCTNLKVIRLASHQPASMLPSNIRYLVA